MKRIAFVLAAWMAASSAISRELNRTDEHIACAARVAKDLGGAPDAPAAGMHDPETEAWRKVYYAHQAKISDALKGCYTEADVRELAEVNASDGLVMSTCGGSWTPKKTEVMEGIPDAYLNLFVDTEMAIRKARARTQPSPMFCRGVYDSYGPKGAIWPGLYRP